MLSFNINRTLGSGKIVSPEGGAFQKEPNALIHFTMILFFFPLPDAQEFIFLKYAL
jgi:hypothetical protein